MSDRCEWTPEQISAVDPNSRYDDEVLLEEENNKYYSWRDSYKRAISKDLSGQSSLQSSTIDKNAIL